MANTVLRQAPERFALASVSMGGMVALEIMRTAPKRVTHLGLMDIKAAPDAPGRKMLRYLANLVVRFGDFGKLATRSVKALVHPEAPDAAKAELLDMSVRVGASTYRRQNRAVAACRDARPVLSRIAAPTTVIVGREGRLTPEVMSRDIHQRLAGLAFHVIADCGHLPPIERPETVAALLRDLLAR